LKNKISYPQLKSILHKDKSLVLVQEKWKRDIANSSIIVSMENYTLSVTENKRELVYNSWGELVDTIPLLFKDGVLIKRNPPIVYYLPPPK
jgi:hypothetical protein